MQPLSDSSSSSFGTAVISLDLPSTAIWPSSRRCSADQAWTICSGDLPVTRSNERRSVLPSTATTPRRLSAKRCMKRVKQVSNAFGSSRRNTRLKVSWLGVPWRRRRNCRRYGALISPNSAMSEQSSPPDSKVQSAIINNSCRSWRALSRRGATTSAKQATNSSTGRPQRWIARPDFSHAPYTATPPTSANVSTSAICDSPAFGCRPAPIRRSMAEKHGETSGMAGIFAGLRVIDAASYVAGPSAATILGDFGAEVIKLEPSGGDAYRALATMPGQPRGDTDYPWVVDNRGKRGLVLDLKRPEAQAVLHRLILESDVFVTNAVPRLRPGLGIAPDALAALNPRLIYAALTAYGECGPEADKTGFDATAYWARSGLMDLVR